MKDLVLKAISQFELLEKDDTVTVALSGGADSMALLHVLNSLKEELEITVNAAHLNHSIRGIEADNDQKFVQEFCETNKIVLFCEKINVPQFAKDNHISIELAARQIRYEFLQRVAVGKIATAHTASDNLETMIFNLTRGTALKGLCGIPPKRDNIIRPVIFCTRENIEKYCADNNLPFVTDSTNLSDDYSRNKIRHKVIPVLKEINQNAEISAVKTAVSLTEDYTFIQKEANELLFSLYNDDSLLVTDFINLDEALAKRVIIGYFGICYPEISLESQHINEIYSACIGGKSKVNLPSNMYAVVKNNQLTVTDGTFECQEFSVKITEIENVNNLFSNNLIDCDKIIGKLNIRTREEGDKIKLKGRGYTKKLKSLFTEYKIPLNVRENLPVIADEQGVIWVHNIGVAERVAAREATNKILKIEVLSGGSKDE